LAFGFRAPRFGNAIKQDGVGGVSSHQPSFSNRRGSRDRRNRTMMIFPMARGCAADWQRVCPGCSEFAEFCAESAQLRFLRPMAFATP
jgi:hypothetical protein